MENNRCNASSSAPRIERKTIEKNRRNKMKNLYNNLMSLLPNNVAKQGMPIPDQIDEAVEYIKCLNTKMQSLRRKKESLLLPITNSNRDDNIYNCCASSSSSPTLVRVQDMGPHVDVIVANGLSSYSSFSSLISSLIHRQHGVEIASASFCKDGNSSIQVLKAHKAEKSVMSSGPAGFSTGSDMNKEVLMSNENSKIEQSESHDLNLWDYEVDDNTCIFKM